MAHRLSINLAMLPGAVYDRQQGILQLSNLSVFFGEKGAYLDVVVRETLPSRYGSCYIVKQFDPNYKQGEQNAQFPIIGNGKPL